MATEWHSAARHDVSQRAVDGRVIVLVTVDQDGRQAAVSGESPNLIEPDAGLLALLDRGLMAV